MSDKTALTEDAFIAALDACWTEGEAPSVMYQSRFGHWCMVEMTERGHMRYVSIGLKAARHAEQALARQYGPTYRASITADHSNPKELTQWLPR